MPSKGSPRRWPSNGARGRHPRQHGLPDLRRDGESKPCRTAFIDAHTPGSDTKENFAIIGGVSESPDQHVHVKKTPGFNGGAAGQPPKCRNSLHSHRTVEVFFVLKGRWRFFRGRWARPARGLAERRPRGPCTRRGSPLPRPRRLPPKMSIRPGIMMPNGKNRRGLGRRLRQRSWVPGSWWGRTHDRRRQLPHRVATVERIQVLFIADGCVAADVRRPVPMPACPRSRSCAAGEKATKRMVQGG